MTGADPAGAPPAGASETAPPPQAGRRVWRYALLAALVVVIAVLGYGYAETYRLEVKRYTVATPDVPAAFDGLEIAFLTDIHRSGFFSQGRIEGIADRVNDLGPDLILLGGDYVYGSTGYQDSCFQALSRLHAPLGTYAVLGNHDYGVHDRGGRDLTGVLDAMAKSGVTLLRNEGVWLERAGERIRLGGAADFWEDQPLLDPVIAGASVHDLVVLVSHNPDYAEELPAGAVDLVLSGHTHGGQATFFGLWAPHVPSEYGQRYRSGLVQNDATTVIVSNGVGTIFPPVRLFARPQIVIVTLLHP